jgi:CheY-like chemotaxis protein
VTLESADIVVDEASTALEAQAYLRRRRPDVIVLDLRMPGMSGVESAGA